MSFYFEDGCVASLDGEVDTEYVDQIGQFGNVLRVGKKLCDDGLLRSQKC